MRHRLIGCLVLGLAVVGAGCDGSDGSGGAGAAGSGGGDGGGGTGGTTTTKTPTIEACPVNAEVHVASTIVGPDGVAVGDVDVDVTGVVTGFGVDSPPTFECGSGLSWATVVKEGTSEEWLGCFQAPGLVMTLTNGDTAQLKQVVVTHPIAPATLHTELRGPSGLLVYVEWASVEEEVALPEGLSVARDAQVCDAPDNPCKTEGYNATVTPLGTDVGVAVAPGELTPVGAHKVYLDRYWIETISSGCDGGGANILLSVTPN